MFRGMDSKRKSILMRIIIAAVALIIAAVIIFIASGFAKYVFDFDGYVRSLVPKNYALEDVTLENGEKKSESGFSVFLSEVKIENGKTVVKFTLNGTESFSSGKVVRTDAIRKKADAYAAEIYLSDGENTYLLSQESSSVYRASATYVYSLDKEISLQSAKVIFKKLIVTGYAKK